MAGGAATPPLISGYANGGFTVAGEFHPGSVLVFEAGDGFTIRAWPATDPDRLAAADFAPLLKAGPPPDLLLLGVGGRMDHSFAKLRMAMTGKGVPLEVQTTPAICRTWNLLLGEGRRVALAAIPPGPEDPPGRLQGPAGPP